MSSIDSGKNNKNVYNWFLCKISKLKKDKNVALMVKFIQIKLNILSGYLAFSLNHVVRDQRRFHKTSH